MLDPQVDTVRGFVDDTAERMALLGVPPNGLPGALVKDRDWDDYELMRADVSAHLAALDLVYDGILSDHRRDIEVLDDLDLVTQDMLIAQVAELEKFQWFIRAHLQNVSGESVSAGAGTEEGAAAKAVKAAGASE